MWCLSSSVVRSSAKMTSSESWKMHYENCIFFLQKIVQILSSNLSKIVLKHHFRSKFWKNYKCRWQIEVSWKKLIYSNYLLCTPIQHNHLVHAPFALFVVISKILVDFQPFLALLRIHYNFWFEQKHWIEIVNKHSAIFKLVYTL